MKNKIIISSILLINSLYANVLLPSAAYELALTNSNEIKSNSLQLESKKEDLNQLLSKYYPQIDLTFDYNHTDYEYNELQNRTNYDITEKSLDSILSLRQSIYNRETNTKVDLERKRVKLAEIQLNKQKQELSKDIFKAYLTALSTNNKIDLLNSYLLYNEQILQSVEKKYTMNLSSKMDLLEATLEVNRSKIDLIKEKKLLKTYLFNLEQLTNTKDITLPKINFENFEISSIINGKDLSKNQNSYIKNNLEYIEASEAIKLSNLELLNAQSAHYPTLDFDARYTDYRSNSITTDYENSMRISLKLKIPLYSGGYVSSRIKSSKILKKASVEDLESVKKDLTLRYSELLSLLNTSRRSVDIYKEALISAKAYLEFITQGYDNGLKSSIDLYEAKSKVFEIKYDYIQNIQDFIQVYVDYLILNNDIQRLNKIDNIIQKG